MSFKSNYLGLLNQGTSRMYRNGVNERGNWMWLLDVFPSVPFLLVADVIANSKTDGNESNLSRLASN